MHTQSIIFGGLLFAQVNTALAADAVDYQQLQVVKKALSNFISDNRAPGLQYILIDDKQILFHFDAGLADIMKQTPVTPATTFNGYSITKTFTAAAVIKLAQRGKIDLDTPITQYLPQLPYTPPPTVRQLLQHTSGIPNPNPLKWIHKNEDHAAFDEQAFIQKVILENDQLNDEPGEKFAYSNIGYMILGQLVQAVSGKTFTQFVNDDIIAPLKLKSDEIISFNIDNPSLHARGYIRKWNWLNLLLGFFIDRDSFMESAKNGWSSFKLFMPNGKAYGGLTGNAAGFSRYLQAMINRQPPFTDDMLDLLWQQGKTNDGEELAVTMAWFKNKLNNLTYYAHSGGAGGYYCEIRIYPDVKRASVIMTNNTGISAQHYLDEIDALIFPELLRVSQ